MPLPVQQAGLEQVRPFLKCALPSPAAVALGREKGVLFQVVDGAAFGQWLAPLVRLPRPVQ